MILQHGRHRCVKLLIIVGLTAACSQPQPATHRPEAPDAKVSAPGSAPSAGNVDAFQTPVEPEPPVNTATSGTDAAKTGSLAYASNRFGLSLYRQLQDQPGNLFFSPYSIATALTMTYAGARGNTAAEMLTTLHLPAGDVHSAAATLIEGIGTPSDAYELRIANRLWAQQGLTLLDDFRSITSQYYSADVGLLDFASASAQARATINHWVENETNAKITDLLPPASINSLTRLVLTNAIYFKGTWVSQFDEGRTRDAAFFGAVESTVPMMYQRTHLSYATTESFQALRLPYEGDVLSMLVLLPRDRNGLAALERELGPGKIDTVLSDMHDAEVDVWLPRFSASSQFLLNRTLKELGMKDAFDPSRADFSGITGKKELHISAAIHKAFVEVNEEGSEAAAATAVMLAVESSNPVISFRADHPFVFMIRDDRSGAVLFLGRLVNPES